ncbi:MAG: SpoIIE family protein phosphatase [Ignavibacteriales bacterium]|nr:SpoIIE family protein phosphatase [Ignavibacteriales bacterium]
MDTHEYLRTQLLDRKSRLLTAMKRGKNEQLNTLLQDVDIALEKMAKGTFGVCETCHDSIEHERIMIDPLARNCLDHLNSEEQRTLEQDLDLAYQVQSRLLPKQDLQVGSWRTAYHYQPAGPVSGDYCDLITPERDDGSLYFFTGDVSGKGVASSILMAQLYAIFRSLTRDSGSMHELVEKANHLFCDSVIIGHFATLVAGKADASGRVEICNAGHCLPILVKGEKVEILSSTGLPLGMFCKSAYTSLSVAMDPEDTLILYSDGVTESRNSSHWQYGEQRLREIVSSNSMLAPQDLLKICVEDVKQFRSGAAPSDDMTILILRRQ